MVLAAISDEIVFLGCLNTCSVSLCEVQEELRALTERLRLSRERTLA